MGKRGGVGVGAHERETIRKIVGKGARNEQKPASAETKTWLSLLRKNAAIKHVIMAAAGQNHLAGKLE